MRLLNASVKLIEAKVVHPCKFIGKVAIEAFRPSSKPYLSHNDGILELRDQCVDILLLKVWGAFIYGCIISMIRAKSMTRDMEPYSCKLL